MRKIKIIAISILFFLAISGPALAATFNPNFIISDQEMFDWQSMTQPQIQKFLETKEGILKNLVIESAPYEMDNPCIKDELEKSKYNKNLPAMKMEASAIIYLAAKRCKINPKLILVKLQHEASLIDNPKPSDTSLTWATGYAVCDSCNIWDPQVSAFGGFGQQIDYLARIIRKYTDRPQESNSDIAKMPVGSSFTFTSKVGNVYPPYDKKKITNKVIFSNVATKNLYAYTPHVYTYFYNDDESGEVKYVGGNFNFWRIWNRWFGKAYPDGSLLQIKDNDPLAAPEEKQVVWLLKNNQRRAFHSKSALSAGYDINKILYVDKKELDNYDVGKPIKFPNYSILQGPDNNKYLIVDDKKRLISSDEIFKNIGYNPEEIEIVEQTDLDLYEDGAPLSQYSIYPTGALLQNKLTGGIYYVESSLKRSVYTKDILKLNYPNRKIIPVSPEELDTYLTGKPIKLNDGNLIKTDTDPAVYVISNGWRRPIASAKVFEELGYKWKNIIRVSKETVEIHPLGDVIGK